MPAAACAEDHDLSAQQGPAGQEAAAGQVRAGGAGGAELPGGGGARGARLPGRRGVPLRPAPLLRAGAPGPRRGQCA